MMRNQIISKLSWSGTCGKGIWITLCRYKDYPESNISFDEFNILPYEKKVDYLKDIRQYLTNGFDFFNHEFDKYKGPWFEPGLIEHFIQDCYTMWTNTTASKAALDLNNYDHVIFENGQGLMLNDEGKDDPEKTPSYTGLFGVIHNGFQFKRDDYVKIHYVTRPYLTRHGSEQFEDKKVDGDIDKSTELNQYNEFQKDFKYNDLELDDLQAVIQNDLNDIKITTDRFNASYVVNLDITHCDELDREKEFKSFFKESSGPVSQLNFYGDRRI